LVATALKEFYFGIVYTLAFNVVYMEKIKTILKRV